MTGAGLESSFLGLWDPLYKFSWKVKSGRCEEAVASLGTLSPALESPIIHPPHFNRLKFVPFYGWVTCHCILCVCIYIYIYIYHNFIHSSVNGHLGCFHALTIVNYTEWSKSEREKQILHINTYIWNLEKWYWWTDLQDRNGDTDVENGLVGTAVEGEGGTNWESSMEIHTLPCVK